MGDLSKSASTDRGAEFDRVQRLLYPKSIAFVGGTRAIAAWRVTRAHGFTGETYLVNPLKAEVDGIKTFARLEDLPVAPDASYVALDPAKTIAAARSLSGMGAGGMVVFGAGFSEAGPEGKALEDQLIAACGPDLPLIGPNCYGIINLESQGSLWPIDYPVPSHPPNTAFISQSGNVCINVVGNQRGVPLRNVISLGNQAGLQVHDLIDHFVADGGIKCIGLYLDGLKEIDAFVASAMRAAAKGVGIIALKAGRSDLSAELAMSHTGSLAGSFKLYEALFERCGVVWVQSIPELLEGLKIWSHWGAVASDKVAIMSCSGGESGIAADFAATAGLDLPPLSAQQIERIDALMPAPSALANPVDLTTALYGKHAEISQAVSAIMAGPAEVAVMVMDFAGDGLDLNSGAGLMCRGLAEACAAAGKKAVVAAMKPEAIGISAQNALLDLGVLPMQGLDTGLMALGKVARASMRQHAIRQAPPAPLLGNAAPKSPRFMDEAAGKAALAGAGLPVPKGRKVPLAEAGSVAAEIGFPVVVKLCHPELLHKTEAGGVALNLMSAEAVDQAVRGMQSSAQTYAPHLQIEHVLVERMVTGVVAELIMGLTFDPQFGLSMVIGTGGIFVELLKDSRLLLLPTDRSAIEEAVRSLAGAPLFMGMRGRKTGDFDAIVDAALALAGFAEGHLGKLSEVDINPLFVLAEGQGVLVGDALVGMASE